ncbi:MAG: Hint domain-containing protein [Rhodobacter sp.]|nr:Hint domain-containing protein [Rhodobacter sp.]
MATYTIVLSTQTPLGPGEINAGGTITVAEGDVFIIDPSADSNTTFNDGGGGPFDFEVQVAASNSNTFNLTFQGGTNPTVDIADGVDLSNIDIAAQSADSLPMTIGDNVTLGKLDGSSAADSITIGADFTAAGDWNLGAGDDTLTAGLNADFTASKLKGELGDDVLTFGDGASFNEIDGGAGSDTLYFGDNITGAKIVGGADDDFIRIGANATISDKVDGNGGTDTLNTQTTGLTETSIETTNGVSFAAGTQILTDGGEVPVEALLPGDIVNTLDHGPQPVRWTRIALQPLETIEEGGRPVLIQKKCPWSRGAEPRPCCFAATSHFDRWAKATL